MKYIRHDGSWIPVAQYHALKDRSNRSDHPAPLLIRDIEPYRSMATGETITSRSHHRQHLKDHGLVELGNDCPTPKGSYEPAGVEQDMHEAYQQLSDGAEVPELESEIVPE